MGALKHSSVSSCSVPSADACPALPHPGVPFEGNSKPFSSGVRAGGTGNIVLNTGAQFVKGLGIRRSQERDAGHVLLSTEQA